MNEELEALLLTEGLINVRGHRHLARRVAREVGRETLVRLLPGIYAAPKDAHDFQVRAKALALADPNAIFVRHTAARLTWWEELSVPRVQAVTRRAPAEGFSFEQRSIPPDLRVAGTQAYVTAAALTVLELIGSMGGKPISEALRRGATTLEELREAIGMMPGRRGNKERWRLLLDSAHEPWSELEREAHRSGRLGVPQRLLVVRGGSTTRRQPQQGRVERPALHRSQRRRVGRGGNRDDPAAAP